MIEHALSPNKPIYLLGDSFGGALALAVAACNPSIDLVLILANPGQPFIFLFLFLYCLGIVSFHLSCL